MDLREIYKALRSEYNGKTWSDEFMRIHVTLMRDGQVICWFDLDKDDEGFEEKRDCAISFYDEVVRFLVDSFGEEFKYEDPRISGDYIEKNNMYGQYEIVLDDDGENAPVIAIWENEESEMKKKSFGEGFMSNMGKDGQHLYSIIYKFDGWDGSVQEYGKTEEDAIQNAIAKGKIDDEDEIVKIVDLGERGEYLESSRKLVKEGAGAGYDVGISDLEIDKVTEVKALDDGDYSFTATIKPGNYEISAESYYDDFFWEDHEFGITPEAKIDGGVIHGTICPWEDTDDPERWVSYQVEGTRFDLSFMYGAGWMHSNLPEDGQLYIDEHLKITPDPYFSVDDIQLDAIDLVQAVNAGYASLDDRYNDEEKDDVPVDESMGGKREVFTIEVNYIDEEDEPQMIEAMKYAKTYYSINGALNAAKEAYQEYSRSFDEPIEVWILGGEYEMPEGDIYGEPEVIEVVNSETIGKL